MSEVTQDGPVVTVGRVVIDLGVHNQEEAAKLAERLANPGVTVTVDGERV